MYAVDMGIGDHIKAAMQRNGIEGTSLAKRLHVTPNAVYSMQQRENTTLATLAGYADALTQELAERGDPRIFTPESLQAGPDPVLPTDAPDAQRFVVGRATSQPGDAPDPSELVQSLVRDALARHLPLETAAGWRPGDELAAAKEEIARLREPGLLTQIDRAMGYGDDDPATCTAPTPEPRPER